jgi:DNA-binding LytR/AlgR family response regulator
MYHCIIIDDEEHAIEGLKAYISTLPELSITQTYLDPLLALKEIERMEPVDLIFLDVDMPKINGIELAAEIRNKTKKLVFTTGHSKYAYEAFEANADAYLLKPYSLGKFIIAINKLFPETAFHKTIKEDDTYFFVKSKEDDLRMVRINYDEIVVVEGQQNYIMIHTKTKKILTYMSLIEITAILTRYGGFMQLHRSFVANMVQIEHIDGSMVKMNNGMRIGVGEYYRKNFNDFLSAYLIKAGKRK